MRQPVPTCSACGGPGPAGHRCPRLEACVDCGQPADMFVANAEHLVLDEAEMIERLDVSHPDADAPLCDGCFYARARRQMKAGAPTGPH